ncbi:MAG: FHA domain-containing protein, partial [Planctomycetota bacterium]
MDLGQLIERYRGTGQVPPHPVLLEERTPGGEEGERQVLLLPRRPRKDLVVGRSSSAPLCVPDPNVSSQHARLLPPSPERKAWSLVDLGSTNGTFVGAHALEPHRPFALRDREQVRFGPTRTFRFLRPASLERTLRELARTLPRPRRRRAE